jgi:hypothetical protein
MKVLLIAEKNHYRDWIGKTYYDILIHYKNNSKNEVKLMYTDNKLTITDINNWTPNIVVFLDTDTLRFAEKYRFIFNLNIPIFASSLDFFYFEDCINCQWIQKCRGLLHFGHASKLLNSYKEHFPEKIINSFKGRFINSNIFKNYNLDKKYDILIYGTRKYLNNIENHYADKDYKQKWEKYNNKLLHNKHNFYPLREKIELLLQHQDKYRLHIVTSACIFDAHVANEDLSRLINQSWLTMTTSSRADIPMAKYFEIGASYSGILGNIPSDYNDLFKNNIVEVTEWMSDEEILSTIDKALEDKQKLQQMVLKLGNKIHNEYNLDKGIEDMDRVFDHLI